MNIEVVIASINELSNIAAFYNQAETFKRKEVKIIIIDEGNALIRKKNRKLLSNIDIDFYGPKERENWFAQRFGSAYPRYLDVIPQRCHAETSFGFLVAYEDNADVIIELDDDVFPEQGHDMLKSHLRNLLNEGGMNIGSRCKWYNTLENLLLDGQNSQVFPRGHPYLPEARFKEDYVLENNTKKCILNMGLWTGNPDLDALTILYNGGLDGRCNAESKNFRRGKVVAAKGTYFSICSMNTSFVRKIVPAFYQLYMNSMGIDRFDDIWSGILLKKIADQLGDRISLGRPLVHHEKRPRNIFNDLRSELEGMVMNEIFWKTVDSLELSGGDYSSCYREVADGLENNVNSFDRDLHKAFLIQQVQKMRIWLEIMDKLE